MAGDPQRTNQWCRGRAMPLDGTLAEGIRHLGQQAGARAVSPFPSFQRFEDPTPVPGGIQCKSFTPDAPLWTLAKTCWSPVAAVRVQDAGGVTCECRTYGTTANQLSTLRGWLVSHGVTPVVMEATGSYWKSIWRALEGHFELTLANPRQIRSLPGRKSDVKDARRIVDFHAHGLIQGSFVPPAQIDAVRELTRTRKQFVREVNRHTQRIQKILDVANVKITGLITDTLGVSGRAILKVLIAGQTDPERLAALAHPRLRASRAQLVEALQGQPTEQQRSLLGMHLQLIETLETSIAHVDDLTPDAP
jgi:transposase